MTLPNPVVDPDISDVRQLGQPEFVALMAMLIATVAFSIDSMLPALPEIAGEVSPEARNKAQLIISSFFLGLGLGTFVTGPLSDAFGRKPVVLCGATLYCVGAALAWAAQSLELLLAARVVQGLGASAPRVIVVAIVRDLYEGRTMARIMSFIFLVFTLVPAIAPTLGAGIIWLFGWRGVFASFIVFSAIGATWLALRQPETLPPARRRPFRAHALRQGTYEILSNRPVSITIAVQSLCLGMLIATLSSVQQVFDVTYDRGAHFHFWFGLIAVLSAGANALNARLVEALGMRFIVTVVLGVQIVFSGLVALLLMTETLTGTAAFALYVAWTVGIFAQAGMTLGNLNALAMAPMGHLAGLAASVVGALSTIASVALAAPIGLLFDGTPYPLIGCSLLLAVLALLLMRYLDATTRDG